MNSNANYLLSPNKLSTKVAYAPGGNSSLSLAWDTPNPVASKPKSKSLQPTSNYQINENLQAYHIPQNHKQFKEQPREYSQEYYQPMQQNYKSMSESNRLLEQELRYYQQKNKMLRQNIFGGYENLQKISKFANNNSQFQPNYYQYTPSPPLNNYSKQYYQRGNEQLDFAVYQQDRKRQRERISSESSFVRNTSNVPNYEHYQQKTSVRVNNPPGGRSSIVFG